MGHRFSGVTCMAGVLLLSASASHADMAGPDGNENRTLGVPRVLHSIGLQDIAPVVSEEWSAQNSLPFEALLTDASLGANTNSIYQTKTDPVRTVSSGRDRDTGTNGSPEIASPGSGPMPIRFQLNGFSQASDIREEGGRTGGVHHNPTPGAMLLAALGLGIVGAITRNRVAKSHA